MWLRNYYNLLTANVLGDTTATNTNTPTDYTAPIRVRALGGSYTNVYSENKLYAASNSTINAQVSRYYQPFGLGKEPIGLFLSSMPSYHWFAVQLGTGTTPETYDDYELDAPITSGLTMVTTDGTLAQDSVFDPVTHHYKSVRKFTVNNSSSSPVTINEFGIITNGGIQQSNVMIYREVLTTPVTLAPSESIVFEFTHDAEVYNYTPY